MPETTDMVWVSEKEYNRLLEQDRRLSALKAWGVDNWEGYGEALSSLYEEGEDE